MFLGANLKFLKVKEENFIQKAIFDTNKLHVISTQIHITRTVKPRMKGFESTFDKIRATFVK